MNSINSWPSAERPRERLLNQGAESLSDAQLLAIFLRTGTHGKTAVDVAMETLTQHGSIAQFLNASAEIACRQPGIGPAKFATMQAALELGRRYLHSNIEALPSTTEPNQVKQFIALSLRNKTRECFGILFMNNQLCSLGFEILFEGSHNKATVFPRDIAKAALQKNASCIIVAHNHPSGDPTPSLSDKQLTQQLKKTLMLVDVKLLDHIIVAKNRTISFAEQGLI